MINMVTEGTKMSGSAKRYKTAYEAGKAGADVMYQVIMARGNPGIPLTNFSLSTRLTSSPGKLSSKTADWPTTYDSSITIDPADANTFDVSFDLGEYRAYAKITDTVVGNSSAGGGGGGSGTEFSTGGTINAKKDGEAEIAVPSYPYLYAIEILAAKVANPLERAKVSILYQY
jgi:hypothetical protein